ncbi:hypothetical protein Tco_0381702 [Tanacetum coccineum]
MTHNFTIRTNWASLVGHQDSLEAWEGMFGYGRSQVRVPPGTFTPSGGIGGSTVQHTAQLNVTAEREPLTTNKPLQDKTGDQFMAAAVEWRSVVKMTSPTEIVVVVRKKA